MNKRGITLPLILAVLVVAGVYLLLNNTIKPVQVVVAKQDLMAGTLITEDLVEVKTMQRGNLPDGTYASIADVVGKTLVVARVSGDPLTSYVVGDATSASGIPAMLAPNTVAIAVRVDQATGLAGILRPGQTVTVIGIIDPSKISQGQTSIYSSSLDYGLSPTLSASDLTYNGQPIATATPAPTATPQPPISPAARVAISGLRVLVVPQTFRYEEVDSSSTSDGYSVVRTTSSGQNNSVILVEASIIPTEIAPGVIASQAEVLALLNDVAVIHLALEPNTGVVMDVNAEGVDLAKLYEAITGYKLNP